MSKTNLPAALNDPRLTRRETDFFTKTWGESFDNYGVMPSPDLPEITKEHFRKYLKRTSKVRISMGNIGKQSEKYKYWASITGYIMFTVRYIYIHVRIDSHDQ